MPCRQLPDAARGVACPDDERRRRMTALDDRYRDPSSSPYGRKREYEREYVCNAKFPWNPPVVTTPITAVAQLARAICPLVRKRAPGRRVIGSYARIIPSSPTASPAVHRTEDSDPGEEAISQAEVIRVDERINASVARKSTATNGLRRSRRAHVLRRVAQRGAGNRWRSWRLAVVERVQHSPFPRPKTGRSRRHAHARIPLPDMQACGGNSPPFLGISLRRRHFSCEM